MFTYHYAQPDDYHFSLDSIQFAELVAKNLQTRTDLKSMRILDLCAGCGVIGIELSWHLRDIRKIHFIEVQDIYTPYFQKNIAIVNRPELQLHWHLLNYDELLKKEWENKFDLIVSNPPYFQSGQGILSPSSFKSRCRFYLDSTFENFILAIVNSLAPGGQAYFLQRPLQLHGHDLFANVQQLLHKENVSIKKVTQIRGTDVILVDKLK